MIWWELFQKTGVLRRRIRAPSLNGTCRSSRPGDLSISKAFHFILFDSVQIDGEKAAVSWPHR